MVELTPDMKELFDCWICLDARPEISCPPDAQSDEP